ncbi:DUF4436 family protein [Nocardia sp. NPDC020380]|uniref:DUF4436 family protein n=1 Tax=Nocardia sp. NPDC020380 TaxID=3364309 RepID=UPI0037941270
MVKRLIAIAAAIAVLAAAMAASLAIYQWQRDRGRTVNGFGDYQATDRVELYVWITRVDPAVQQVSVQLTPHPRGRFEASSGAFAADTTIRTSGQRADPVIVRANTEIPTSELTFAMTGGGMITDYPFDKYDSNFAFVAENAEGPIPLVVDVQNGDTFFGATPRFDPADNQVDHVGLILHIHRSAAALIFAVFVMVLMLGVAAAAAAVALHLITRHRNLVFPGCTLLAAILFALIPLRNAVPGAPPIGSIIDFASFFLAEAVVAISLITAILVGAWRERGQ